MPEYIHTETRWKCDFCSRDVLKGKYDPSGWHESLNFYGCSLVCCPDCTEQMKTFCTKTDKSFPLPKSLGGNSE